MLKRIVVVVLVFAASLNAGWIVTENTKYSDGVSFTSKSFFQDGKYKSQDGEEIIIIDLKKSQIYFLYESKELYFGGNIDAIIEELRKHTRTEMDNDEARIIGEPLPEEDEQPEIELVKKGIKVGKYNTTKYQVVVDGELKEELFVAKEIDLSKEIDQKKLIETMLRLSGKTIFNPKEFYELSSSYQEILASGYPVRTITYETSGDIVLSEVTNIEKKDLSIEEFLPPKGYKKVTPQEIYHID